MHPMQLSLMLQATTGQSVPHTAINQKTPAFTIPQNIYVNGKFVPNVDNIQVEYWKKPKRGGYYSPPNLAKIN